MTDLSKMVRGEETLGDLVAALDRAGGDLAHLVVHAKGKSVGAIVVVRGEDTQHYLAAVCQKERELEALRQAESDR